MHGRIVRLLAISKTEKESSLGAGASTYKVPSTLLEAASRSPPHTQQSRPPTALIMPTTNTRMLLLGLVHLLLPTIAMFAATIVTATPEHEPHHGDSHRRIYIATSVFGGCLYTATGLANILLLRGDSKISPRMAYSNSIMAWSACFFGPAIAFVHIAPLDFLLDYGKWYCIPNFGWGVEWGLQLLGPAGSGLRAAVLMTLSIGSYFLKFAFPPAEQEIGFLIAFLPQVAGAIIMCCLCFRRFRSAAAAKALIVWVTACMFFLVLSAVDVGDSFALQTARTIAVQLCDNTQIHFSIRFFVCMFRVKHSREPHEEVTEEGVVVSSPSDYTTFVDVKNALCPSEEEKGKPVEQAKEAAKAAAGSWWH